MSWRLASFLIWELQPLWTQWVNKNMIETASSRMSSSNLLLCDRRWRSVRLKWPWPWTATCVQPSSLCSPSVLRCLLARTIGPSWSTPCSTQFTVCPAAEPSPRLRGMSLRSVSCHFASQCFVPVFQNMRAKCASCKRAFTGSFSHDELWWNVQVSAALHAATSAEATGVWRSYPEWICKDAPQGLLFSFFLLLLYWQKTIQNILIVLFIMWLKYMKKKLTVVTICFCPRLAFDQSLWALLEVLLPA